MAGSRSLVRNIHTITHTVCVEQLKQKTKVMACLCKEMVQSGGKLTCFPEGQDPLAQEEPGPSVPF